MKQRVNIHYSVDLDELPEESQRILNKAVKKLGDCASGLQRLNSNLNKDRGRLLTSSTVDAVSSLREELANVDFMLDDLTKIIGGYVTYQIGQSIGEESQPEPQSPPDEHVLRQKIEEQMSKLNPEELPTEMFDRLKSAEEINSRLANFKKGI
tara:strand:- start:648 stop:1106 length:459 start_codon:yes stop_codon:yes gene_type:complete